MRLLPTASRFDGVYAGIFRCGRKQIRSDYPHLFRWLRDMLQLTGPDLFDLDDARRSYYSNLFPLNPGGIVPTGPGPAELRLPSAKVEDPTAFTYRSLSREEDSAIEMLDYDERYLDGGPVQGGGQTAPLAAGCEGVFATREVDADELDADELVEGGLEAGADSAFPFAFGCGNDEAGEEKAPDCEAQSEERRRHRTLSDEGGVVPVAADRWVAAWRERFECWYLGLPLPTQQQLGGCMGALAIHLGSRLDASWHAAQAALGRGPVRAAETAGSAAEPGCEWLGKESRFELPVFPELPFPVDSKFRLPPMPELLPNWRRLISLTHVQQSASHVQQSASAVNGYERDTAASWLAASAASSVAFVGTLTLVNFVVKRLCHAKPVHLTTV